MSSFLSANELAQMRRDQDRTLLHETCTLLTAASSTNAIGERTLTWGTAGTAVPCRLMPTPMLPWARGVAGQVATQAYWSLTLPHGTAISPGDRVVIDAVTYEVSQSWDEETFKTASRVSVFRVEV